jgi:hypothetical protein
LASVLVLLIEEISLPIGITDSCRDKWHYPLEIEMPSLVILQARVPALTKARKRLYRLSINPCSCYPPIMRGISTFRRIDPLLTLSLGGTLTPQVPLPVCLENIPLSCLNFLIPSGQPISLKRSLTSHAFNYVCASLSRRNSIIEKRKIFIQEK